MLDGSARATDMSQRLVNEEGADSLPPMRESLSPFTSPVPRTATVASSLKDFLLSPSATLSSLMRRTTMLQGRRVALGGAVLNVMNCIMGSGILALPSVMAENGMVLYLALQLLMMIAVDFSLHLLVAASRAQNVVSYEELGVKSFGGRGKLAVCAAVILNNNAAILSYLIVVGDLAPTLAREFVSDLAPPPADPVHDPVRTVLMCALTAIVIFPLSLASSRKIGVLAYCSALSFCVMVLLCVLTTVEYVKLPCAAQVRPAAATPGLHTALALPTLAFSFVCHTAFLPVLRELRDADSIGRSRRPPWRMSVVGHAAILLAGVLYCWAATLGYLTFGRATHGDIFINYAAAVPPGDPFVTVVRLGFLLSVLCTVPMVLFPLRRALLQLFRPSATESLPVNIALSIAEVGALLGVALVVADIKIVLRLAGATSSVLLVFLLPSSLYLRCVPDAPLSARVGACALFGLGVVVSALSFIALALPSG